MSLKPERKIINIIRFIESKHIKPMNLKVRNTNIGYNDTNIDGC